MPYFVPAWALRTIGTSTIALPRKTVRTACHQLIPPSMRLDASMYVGMQADMLTHRAAIDQTDHVRCAGVVGARSGFDRALSGRTSKSGWTARASPLWRRAEMSVAEVVIIHF